MSLAEAKLPAVLATGIICLAAGAGAGVAVMDIYGYRIKESDQRGDGEVRFEKQKGPPGGGMGKGGGGMAKGGGGFGGGGRGAPSAKTQLAQLVVKLDQLTHKPLMIHFDEKETKAVREQLLGLSAMDEQIGR